MMGASVGKFPAVEVESLTRHYKFRAGVVKALDNVSMKAEAGEFMAVVGPSGSGKSTLLNLIGGLDVADSGSVRIDGRDLSTLSQAELARMRRDKIGFVFQSYNLIPVLNVLENVEYVLLLQGADKKERREISLEIISDVGLKGMESRRPAELSGGQQQRAAVARAVASKPKLVLADEPTANLDSATAAGLLDIMANLNKNRGVTFIFSTHDPDVMERASRLVKLHDGQIVSDERR